MRLVEAVTTALIVSCLGLSGCWNTTPCCTYLPATTSVPSPSAAADAATAHSLVERYEAASAAGDAATAWSYLAAQSQAMFPSYRSFVDSRTAMFAGAGRAYLLGAPMTDDPSIGPWLAKSDPGVSDPDRVYAVQVAHPDATTAAGHAEVFYVALDTSGAWKIWIIA